MLGQPFMPWQVQVAEVANEVLPNGLPAFREVIVSVPRQQGKTTWLLSQTLERCTLRDRPQRVAYTAQTGSDARKKLLEDQVPIIEASRMRAAVQQVSRAQGNEGVLFRNGSRVSVLASGVSAGHGKIIDLGEIDEAFDDTDDRREQAILPAMVTRPDAQLIIVSTMGTDASVYLNRKVELGRAAAMEGRTEGVAYFEWAIPEDEDIEDPRAWWLGMPALGYTITEQVVAHARSTMTEGEFRRAFGNQRTRSDERVIPEVTWRAACRGDVAPSGSLSFAWDVSPDRDWATIAVVGDGVGEITSRNGMADHRPGVGWVPARLAELQADHGGTVSVDARGPGGALIPDVEAAGVVVNEMGATEVIQGCGLLYDSIADGLFKVRVSPGFEALDQAIIAATKQPVGDTWRFGRKNRTPITPLMALTVALAASKHPAVEPMFAYSS